MKFLVFGEIIWDLYPNQACIGGAPFNFAAYAAGAGVETSLLSAVGRDSLGDRALEYVREYGVRTDLLLRSSRPTGNCRVTLSESGVPTYDLAEETAYDAISVGPEVTEPSFDLLYFGTLAQRSRENAAELRKLLSAGNCREIFCDLNLRAPFYTEESVRLCLSRGTMVKISREELAETVRLGLDRRLSEPEEAVRALAAAYPNLKIIAVTLDRDGAMALEVKTGQIFYRGPEPVKVVSTVGAGDSFSAAFAVSILRGASVEKALDAGVFLSSRVVAAPEAILRPVPRFW